MTSNKKPTPLSSPPPAAARKPKRAKRAKDPEAVKPKGTVISIPIIETADSEEALRLLAKHVPDWNELNADEKEELARLVISYRERREPVKIRLIRKPEGGYSVDLAGKSATLTVLKLHEAWGASSLDTVNARSSELIKYLSSVGACTDDRYNAALSFMESMAPGDQAESLLLLQMYVTHDAAIRALSGLGTADMIHHLQTYGNLATKLLRASQAQMETLARMRRGGEQVVRHIHVDNRGGQAVIAENVHTGGQNAKVDNQSHAETLIAANPALLGADAFGCAVPIGAREGPPEMQDAWRDKPGSAAGQSERPQARPIHGEGEGPHSGPERDR